MYVYCHLPVDGTFEKMWLLVICGVCCKVLFIICLCMCW